MYILWVCMSLLICMHWRPCGRPNQKRFIVLPRNVDILKFEFHGVFMYYAKSNRKDRQQKMQFVVVSELVESIRRQTGCAGSVSTCPPNSLLANSHSSTVYDLRQHIWHSLTCCLKASLDFTVWMLITSSLYKFSFFF